MLYDPKWNRPTLDKALAFFESKPKEEEYDWRYGTACACGQFAAATGAVGWRGYVTNVDIKDWDWFRLNYLARIKPWTFGALADRVRQAMESGK